MAEVRHRAICSLCQSAASSAASSLIGVFQPSGACFHVNALLCSCPAPLSSLRTMKELGIWVEITTLIIPGLNDDEEELRQIASFIGTLGKETPWHISRFHPMYKLQDRPATSLRILERAREIGLDAGLRYVYTGNVPGNAGENTYCPRCGNLLVDRLGFRVVNYRIEAGKCFHCRSPIDGVDL